MTLFKKRIMKLAEELHEKTVETRRDLHQYPESAWTEFRTTSVIVTRLEKLGYKVQIGKDILIPEKRPGLPEKDYLEQCWNRALNEGANEEILKKIKGGLTGVIGILETGKPGPTVGLRFDIDANDLTESNSLDHRPYKEGFRSQHEEACHACGHDAHTSIGLSIAEILIHLKSELNGRVKLIFQPGEEGMRGAYPMVEAGMLDDVDYLLGLHIGLKANQTGTLISGSYGFLATSKLDAVFKGVSSHAGLAPEEGKNALLAAANAVINLHSIPRHSEGASRVNVGMIQGGSGRNIVPDYAKIKLETRGINTKINQYMEHKARTILQSCADMFEVDLEIHPMGKAPSGTSDQELVSMIKSIGEEMADFSEIKEPMEFGACEDVTFMMERVQSKGGKAVFAILGTNLISGHHTPTFDIDEQSLTQGVKLLSLATTNLLTTS